MEQMKQEWKKRLAEALTELAAELGVETTISAENLMVQKPPKPDMGDLAFPFFPFAKAFRMGPPQIVAKVAEKLVVPEGTSLIPAGPYLNVKVDAGKIASDTLSAVSAAGDDYGKVIDLAGQRIMIEFSSPNTNKPLHLGHLMNDSLGESVSRILKAAGAEVRKVSILNNRGVHICKSMLAYQKFGGGKTPESEGIKGDHFVGDYYVKFAQWEKEDDSAVTQAQEMLRAWEAGDPDTVKLWETMNGWVVEGMNQTYETTGISFDKFYYESDIYETGRQKVREGVKSGVFYEEENGSVWIDLSDIDLDKKLLLREDGTTVYMTQDIGTALARQEDWPADRVIYVVASEQRYHFQVLFHMLKRMGYDWAENLYHLSYGMVNLPEGKMKSREGTVVDADVLFGDLVELAKSEIRSKGRENDVGDLEVTASKIALGALNYFLLQTSPLKDRLFNPKESLSFTGNTGPYLQYMGARISSMLKKKAEREAEFEGVKFDPSLLGGEEERELLALVADLPRKVSVAARDYNPSVIAGHLYDLGKTFSKYYHDHPILNNEDPATAVARLELSAGVLQTLKNGFDLLGIPFLEKM